MSFLVFDVDKSLASVGGDPGVAKLSGIPPVPIVHGVRQINGIFDKLFRIVVKDFSHPIFGKTQLPTPEMLPLCIEQHVQGAVIDTLSVAMKQEIRNITLDPKSGQQKQMQMQDWGTLGRFGDDFFYRVANAPFWVVVMCHLDYDKDQATGNFFWVPQIQGGTKMETMKHFDVIAFATVAGKGKSREFKFIVNPDELRTLAKDRLNVLQGPEVTQDLGAIIKAYQSAGIPNPKILVVGLSGSGKTTSIKTLQSLNAAKKAA